MVKTYYGSCHCGRVRFEVDADIAHVRVCDCSVCRRRGALIHRVAKSNLRLLIPCEELSVYQWGSYTAKDFFCPHCGILPFRRPSDPTPQELLEGIKPFDGWAVRRYQLFRDPGAENLWQPYLKSRRIKLEKLADEALAAHRFETSSRL